MQLSFNQRCEQNNVSVIKYTEAYKAAIVKTVKKKGSILLTEVDVEWDNESQLQTEVLTLMKDWNITAEDFRKCVEGLIESEYIERDSRTGLYIHYV